MEVGGGGGGGQHKQISSQLKIRNDLHPINITQIEKIFSVLVFGETFPNPTLVKLLNVKYKAVIYLDCKSGPLV